LLHAAAYLGHAQIARLLLTLAPSSAARTDEGGRTPLYEAARGGQPATLRLLIEAAPQLASVGRPNGILPLHVAVCSNIPDCRSAEVVRLLLAAAPATATAFDLLDGQLPLMCAAENGHLGAMRLLLAAAPEAASMVTVDLEVRNESDGAWTALHYAADSGNLDAIRLLLDAAPASAAITTPDGRTALHLAACSGKPGAIRLLLDAARQLLP